MSSVRQKILQRKIKDHEERYDRLDEKLKRITKQKDHETRDEEKLRLEAIIEETQQERGEVQGEWEKLEDELKAINQPSPPLFTTTSSKSAEPASPSGKTPADPVTVFYSYAHEDEPLRDKLNKHLKLLEGNGVISSWHDRSIGAGREWKNQISEYLESAQIILLLISADFLASDYINDVELKRAMERHESGEARVIPIILRDADWQIAEFSKLQALPKNAKPVSRWKDDDEAFTDIAKGIRLAAEEIKGLST